MLKFQILFLYFFFLHQGLLPRRSDLLLLPFPQLRLRPPSPSPPLWTQPPSPSATFPLPLLAISPSCNLRSCFFFHSSIVFLLFPRVDCWFCLYFFFIIVKRFSRFFYKNPFSILEISLLSLLCKISIRVDVEYKILV